MMQAQSNRKPAVGKSTKW